MNSHKYKPLDLALGEIRLLILHPGDFTDPIRISLKHAHLPTSDGPIERPKVNLDNLRETLPCGWEVQITADGRVIFWNQEENRSSWTHPDAGSSYVSEVPKVLKISPAQPDFEALSYHWGHENSTHDVHVIETDDFPNHRSTDGDILMPVKKNLAVALRHLRTSIDHRVLWIDAICINQADIEERGRHVACMGNIYEMATRVVAFLGPESGDSTLALETLEEMGKQLEMTSGISIPSPICEHWEWKEEFPCSIDTVQALKGLLNRPWFQRLWIWQEIVLSNADAIVQCGHKTVLWSYIRRGLILLRETNLPDAEMRKGLMPNTLLYMPYYFQGTRDWRGVSSLLQATSQAGCTDQRDRIYGIMGMVDQDIARGIQPDYTLSYEQVFRNFLEQIVEQYKTLLLLQYCDLGKRNMQGPTWVPDWANGTIRPWQLVNAAGLSRAHVTVDQQSGVMRALGVRAARVKAVSGCKWSDHPESVVEVFDMVKDWYTVWRKNVPEESPLEDFITTLRYGWIYERCSIGDHIAPLVEDFMNLIGRGREPSVEELRRTVLLQSIIRDERTCGFFCTDKGHAGLGPVATQEGDIVAIILGSDHAMILRPQADGEKFQVVGPAYIHGMMDAQCLLGEFQQPHAVKIVCNTPKGTIWTSANTETGDNDDEDIRLGPLPTGWVILSNGEFRNERGNIAKEDPRWAPESLRARGVHLREFHLV
ncbi:hypothetical protein GQ43DRAFT_471970 [Delitschia confertaspora ATCC 74209]|uniref:WW domain-containing protein n=1 Tax=Delitschia confertaspora ATCC 74209 TaxID=1513339 RepID=A0A9P4MSP4_9PLEO|nr:hypothetical protein GQ43DRAFT_471970 [Delitschia confertaspora ATCC 74209]